MMHLDKGTPNSQIARRIMMKAKKVRKTRNTKMDTQLDLQEIREHTAQTLILKTTGRRVLDIAAIGKVLVHAGKHGIKYYRVPADQTSPLGTVVVLCIYIAPHNVEYASRVLELLGV